MVFGRGRTPEARRDLGKGAREFDADPQINDSNSPCERHYVAPGDSVARASSRRLQDGDLCPDCGGERGLVDRVRQCGWTNARARTWARKRNQRAHGSRCDTWPRAAAGVGGKPPPFCHWGIAWDFPGRVDFERVNAPSAESFPVLDSLRHGWAVRPVLPWNHGADRRAVWTFSRPENGVASEPARSIASNRQPDDWLFGPAPESQFAGGRRDRPSAGAPG